MPTLSRIRVHPIKALDPVERDRVGISSVGGLAGDRAYAIVDADGEYVNGKRTDAVHRLRAEFDLDADVVSIGVGGESDRERFDLERDRAALEAWLSSYFGYDVTIEAAPGGELTDSSALGGDPPGATVVSTATLEAVADWFEGIDVEGLRDRFRPNLEVAGVPAFWEDRLVGDGTRGFRVGDVSFEAVEPVPRCVVPTRDPDTGEETTGFRERFVERREETFPQHADFEAFRGYFFLTVLAVPDAADRGETIARGDEVAVGDEADGSPASTPEGRADQRT